MSKSHGMIEMNLPKELDAVNRGLKSLSAVTPPKPAPVVSACGGLYQAMGAVYRAVVINNLLDKSEFALAETRKVEEKITASTSPDAVVNLLTKWNSEFIFHAVKGVQASPGKLALYYTKKVI